MSRADSRGLVWRCRIWLPVLPAVLLVVLLVSACSYAPVEGKGCPCDTPAYKCCNEVCIPQDATCVCPSVTLSNPLVTTGGVEAVPDAGTDVNTVLTIDGGREVQLVFGAEPEQWVSYGFKGGDEARPRAELTDDGDGFHVRADLSGLGDPGTSFVGFGLTFRAKKCVDGTAYTGVQFDLSGSMPGNLVVGVTSAGAVSRTDDPDRGTCVEGDLATPMCYGRSTFITDLTPPVRAAFDDMKGTGKPLQKNQIVNVQWQVYDDPNVSGNQADFIVKNVTFYP